MHSGQEEGGRRRKGLGAHARRVERRVGRLAMAGAGMAAGYYFDPDKGAERRHRAAKSLSDYVAARRRRRSETAEERAAAAWQHGRGVDRAA